MIQHVYERASAAQGIAEVIVATDDKRIVRAVEAFGGKVCLTSGAHRSGTERVAEVGRNLEVDVVVNLQGDEPMMDPGCIEAVIEPFRSDPSLMISTLKSAASAQEISDPNVVKVVTDRKGNALYFSRSSIPHLRRERPGKGSGQPYSSIWESMPTAGHFWKSCPICRIVGWKRWRTSNNCVFWTTDFGCRWCSTNTKG